MKLIRYTLLPIVALTLGISPKAHSQRVRMGVHIDPTIRWFTTDNQRFKNVGAQVGVNAGLAIEFYFAERYSFATGVSYDYSGATLRHNQEAYTIKTQYEGAYAVPAGSIIKSRAQFLNIPLGVKLRAVEIGYVTMFATVGLDSYIKLYEESSCDALGLRGERTKGMYNAGYLGYMIRLGIEYSLGGRSAIEAGLGFNGSFTPAYRAGIGRTMLYGTHLRLGFVF